MGVDEATLFYNTTKVMENSAKVKHDSFKAKKRSKRVLPQKHVNVYPTMKIFQNNCPKNVFPKEEIPAQDRLRGKGKRATNLNTHWHKLGTALIKLILWQTNGAHDT